MSLCRLDSLDHLYELGMYINDLCMHDVSRDLVMCGTEYSNVLKNALVRVSSSTVKYPSNYTFIDIFMTRKYHVFNYNAPHNYILLHICLAKAEE